MRAAILARISTSDQQSIPMQLEEMKSYCALRNWSIDYEFTEELSGASKRRPGRDQILKLAAQRKIDVVIVWRLNRFGRSAGELILLLAQLQDLGVAFVSIREQLDLASPIGRLLAGMLAVFAQFEREILVENVKAGITAYRKRQNVWGRPASAKDQTARILQLHNEGTQPADIAAALRLSRASVYRVLKAGIKTQ